MENETTALMPWMAPMTDPLYKALYQGFCRNDVFSFAHPYETYRNWLECVWAFLNALGHEEEFRERLDRHTAEEGAEIGRLLNIYAALVEKYPFHDILGSLFMELDVKSVRAGQYFTPFSVARMMAQISFGSKEEFEKHIAEKGRLTVCDPCVGSGVMLLAFAETVVTHCGREALKNVHFYGQDIDTRCVNMAQIQIRLNGMDFVGRILGTSNEPPPPINVAALLGKREEPDPQLALLDMEEDTLHSMSDRVKVLDEKSVSPVENIGKTQLEFF